ncbi:hypothetical protein TrRE_jg5709 [Triparma retinervis]|uniref:Uncharacterized protein n=1 Tax=Triparma retinervis TaxID=2557542 RepID=A0A9W6ZGT2_9STRA|nr:hypothetical protein TrRE_jg5709 [Triparma retinervis]
MISISITIPIIYTIILIASITRSWLYNVVLPLKLCPFAYRPLVTHSSTEFTLTSADPTLPLSSLLRTLELVSESTMSSPRSTSIVVCAHPSLEDFVSYMDFVNGPVGSLPLVSEGKLQVAPFHPDFRFEGVDSGSVENFVNRSPYPMFHFLREDEVSGAVERWGERGGKTEDIWVRNAEMMMFIGEEGCERIKEKGGVDGHIMERIRDAGFG